MFARLHMCVFLHCLIADIHLLDFWSFLYAKECSTKRAYFCTAHAKDIVFRLYNEMQISH